MLFCTHKQRFATTSKAKPSLLNNKFEQKTDSKTYFPNIAQHSASTTLFNPYFVCHNIHDTLQFINQIFKSLYIY
jgi:hypothetical protein